MYKKLIYFMIGMLSIFPPIVFPVSNSSNINTKVKQYIHSTWDILTRNDYRFFINTKDPKCQSQKQILYISPQENKKNVIEKMLTKIPKQAMSQLQIEYLPQDLSTIKNHGLLYLPYPYVVPGGRFNEMYGWDSYFIELGLLHDNRIGLAKNLVDNLIYEINYYGTILNSNRTYALQRSQPPLLTEMVLSLYEKTHDKIWLRSTLSAINKLYRYWTTGPRYVKEIGLSRYYAGGTGPCPEESPSYYETAINYFQNNQVSDYDKNLFYDATKKKLTPLFFTADRTLREAGFDITSKYGPFGAGILDYVSVDLNVLRYMLEKQTAEIYAILNQPTQEKVWKSRAEKTALLINTYLWSPTTGYYFDFNFKTHQLRPYIFATTFYPLWAHIASPEQAEKLVANLPNLLKQGGIVSSMTVSKAQWDAPFGWAPLQYFAVLGLKDYGYNKEAKEVAKRFVHTINQSFDKTHLIYEKYDVQSTNSEHTLDKISYGYSSNEVGFGWTNGVYVVFNEMLDS